MENNIEKLIRDDFHKRKINPSTNALDRLNAKLDTQTNVKRKKLIRIFAFAASIVGLIFLFQSVFRTTDTNISNEVITNIKLYDSINKQEPNKEYYTPVALDSLDRISNKLTNTTIIKRKNDNSVQIKFVSVSGEKLKSKIKESTLVEKELPIIVLTEKEEIIALNDTVKPRFKPNTISDEELDALLASAMQSLPKKGSDSIEINAQSMLYEIEVEINQPLPEKIFLTLKKGANTVNTLIKSNK